MKLLLSLKYTKRLSLKALESPKQHCHNQRKIILLSSHVKIMEFYFQAFVKFIKKHFSSGLTYSLVPCRRDKRDKKERQ